jgi:KRAB domain-containing zinc finger protein
MLCSVKIHCNIFSLFYRVEINMYTVGSGHFYVMFVVSHAVRRAIWRLISVHTVECGHFHVMCNKSFYRQSVLKIHQRLHTGVRPFSSTCVISHFIRRAIWSYINAHSGMKPFSCNVCNKSFYRQSVLKIHERTHWGVAIMMWCV